MRTKLWVLVFLLSACDCSGDLETEGDSSTVGDSALTDSDRLRDTSNTDGITPFDEACRHIDVLMAVDSSSSMQQELDALRTDAFPPFAMALLDVGNGLESFRVGLTDACPDPAQLFTTGTADGSVDCMFESGEPWIESSSSDVTGEFLCVGDIWTRVEGDDTSCSDSADEDEQPALTAATVLATDPFPRFIRDDALLVVVAITDEDEALQNVGNVGEIYDRIVALKGDVRRVVFLGIGGSTDGCDGPYGSVSTPADELRALTDRFIAADRGFWGDLCTDRLEVVFTDVLEVIRNACEELPELI